MSVILSIDCHQEVSLPNVPSRKIKVSCNVLLDDLEKVRMYDQKKNSSIDNSLENRDDRKQSEKNIAKRMFS